MTSERLGEMFKGDSADTCAEKFPLISMGGRADQSGVRRWGARTPIGARGNLTNLTNTFFDGPFTKNFTVWVLFESDS